MQSKRIQLIKMMLTKKGGLDGRGLPDGRGLLASSSAAGLGPLVGFPDGRGPLVGRLSRRHFQKALRHCHFFFLSSPAALMHFAASFLHLTLKQKQNHKKMLRKNI